MLSAYLPGFLGFTEKILGVFEIFLGIFEKNKDKNDREAPDMLAFFERAFRHPHVRFETRLLDSRI